MSGWLYTTQTDYSSEFNVFMKKNGIGPVKSDPYHPACNNLGVRALKTLKKHEQTIYKFSKDSYSTLSCLVLRCSSYNNRQFFKDFYLQIWMY